MKVRDLLSPDELAAIDLAAVALRKIAQAGRGAAAQLEVFGHDGQAQIFLMETSSTGTVIAIGDVDPNSTGLTPGEALADVELP